MKVQLQRQAVRLRVDEEELAQLLAGESVENLTRFGGDRGWGMVPVSYTHLRAHET